MSWKLIFALSLVGLAVAVATVFVIPQHLEPYAWIGVFVLSAFVIAKRAVGRYFLHGLVVSVLTSLWMTAAHVALLDRYVAGHARVVAFAAHATQLGSARTTIAVADPVLGVAFGLMLGFLAWILSKFVVSSHSEYAGW